MPTDPPCQHLAAIEKVRRPGRAECVECAPAGETWVSLRTCQICGTTRCCDSSPHQHASAHARAAKHHVIASAEPGQRWMYCFEDDATLEY